MILFIIAYIPFPDDVHDNAAGLVQFNEQTKQYIILIDSRQPAAEQIFTLKHEFGHIMLGHMEDPGKPTSVKEHEADNYAHSMTDAFFNAFMSLSKVLTP